MTRPRVLAVVASLTLATITRWAIAACRCGEDGGPDDD